MSTVDLVEIEEKWLRQCGACDAGLSMSCTCPQGDPRNVISNLADEVLRLRIQIATAEDERTLTWSLPPEPGPEVTAVRDIDNDLWTRDKHGGWRIALPDGSDAAFGTPWSELMSYAPLTDATPPP